jgi:hypothetical protein
MSSASEPTADGFRTAIVVFEDRRAQGILRLLRPGFRHCFCLLRSDDGWLLCDPLKGGLRLDLLPAYEASPLAAHYAARGRHVLVGMACRDMPQTRLGIRPLTCVEIVKRALGLVAPGAVTPWQLHARLASIKGWTDRP